MKTNYLASWARCAVLLAMFASCTIAIQSLTAAAPELQLRSQYFIITAAGSISNDASLQGAMAFLDKGRVVGQISTDTTRDPAALNTPHILRGSQIISCPTNLSVWDCTNSTGNFAAQGGSRIGWGLSWSNKTPFLASSIYFRLWSSDPANSLLYVGNVATNTSSGEALTFSSTLRGELWDSNGNIIMAYHNGESISGHPVNRVMPLIREGWYATNMVQIAAFLNYFKSELEFTNFAAFYQLDNSGRVVAGITNFVSTRPYINMPIWSADSRWHVQVEGQRQIGLNYYLQRTASLDSPSWQAIAGGPEGWFIAGTNMPAAFFRAMSTNGPVTPFARSRTLIPSIKVVVSNGPE